jgi:hypothetical protein
MISFATPCSNDTRAHDKFLAILPAIRTQAKLAFRGVAPEAKEEFVAEVVANAFCAYQRLVERGKEDVAHPTPLAWYAIKQVRSGRRVGIKLNVRDVMSPANRRVVVQHFEGEWQEALVEDRNAGPAEIAASRIDMADWLKSLGRGKRRIAKSLARGETTSTVARMFGLTAGRISQLRQELKQSWELFQSHAAVV